MKKHNKNNKHLHPLAIGPFLIASQLITSCSSDTNMQMGGKNPTHTIPETQQVEILSEEDFSYFGAACEAIYDRDNEALTEILKKNPNIINQVGSIDRLFDTITNDFTNFQDMPPLIDVDDKVHNIDIFSNNSIDPVDLLYIAVNNNNEEAVRIILDKGEPCKYINCALIHAIEWQRTNIVELLLESKADPNAQLALRLGQREPFHYTPLYMAAKVNSKEICEILLENGALPNNTAGRKKLMPIHIAAKAGNVDLVKLLIEKGSKIDETSLYLETPILFAVQAVSKECVELLANHGADLSRKYTGKTLLETATELGHVELLDLLVKSVEDLSVEDGKGNTLLHLAVASNNKQTIEFLLHTLDATVTARLISQRNKDGQTPLHKFITDSDKQKDGDILDLLIKHGADIHERYKNHTPFYMAVQRFNKGLAEVAFKCLEIYIKANLTIEKEVVTFMEENLMKSSLMSSDYFNKANERNKLLAFRAALLLNDDQGTLFNHRVTATDLKKTVYEHLINKQWSPTRISNMVQQNQFNDSFISPKNDFTTQEIVDLCSIRMTKENFCSLFFYCPAAIMIPFSVVAPNEFIDKLNFLLEQLPETTTYYNCTKDVYFLSNLMDYLSAYVKNHPEEEWRVDMCAVSIVRYYHNHKRGIDPWIKHSLEMRNKVYDKRFQNLQSLTPYEKALYDAFTYYWNEINYSQEAYNQRAAEHCLSDTKATSHAASIEIIHNDLNKFYFEQLCDIIKQNKHK